MKSKYSLHNDNCKTKLSTTELSTKIKYTMNYCISSLCTRLCLKKTIISHEVNTFPEHMNPLCFKQDNSRNKNNNNKILKMYKKII